MISLEKSKVHALLLSSGLRGDAIESHLGHLITERGYRRAVVVVTAHPKKETAPWASVTKEQLESFGLEVSYVDFDEGETISDEVDLVYVCGGNTYHLLASIQRSPQNVLESFSKLFERGGLYVGSSAGAVICCPSIASAGEVGGDKNTDGITDLTGFGWVPYHVSPHYTPEDDSAIEAFDGTVRPLRDEQGIYLSEGTEVILK